MDYNVFYKEFKMYVGDQTFTGMLPHYNNKCYVNANFDKVRPSRYRIGFKASKRASEIIVDIYFGNNFSLYKQFYEKKDYIDKLLGEKCKWERLDKEDGNGNLVADRRFYLHNPLGNIEDRANWETAFKWFKEKGLLFQKTFDKPDFINSLSTSKHIYNGFDFNWINNFRLRWASMF